MALCSTFSNTLMSLILGSPELDPELQLGLASADQRGRITSLGLPPIHFLMEPRVTLAFASRAHFWLFYGADASRDKINADELSPLMPFAHTLQTSTD